MKRKDLIIFGLCIASYFQGAAFNHVPMWATIVGAAVTGLLIAAFAATLDARVVNTTTMKPRLDWLINLHRLSGMSREQATEAAKAGMIQEQYARRYGNDNL